MSPCSKLCKDRGLFAQQSAIGHVWENGPGLKMQSRQCVIGSCAGNSKPLRAEEHLGRHAIQRYLRHEVLDLADARANPAAPRDDKIPLKFHKFESYSLFPAVWSANCSGYRTPEH